MHQAVANVEANNAADLCSDDSMAVLFIPECVGADFFVNTMAHFKDRAKELANAACERPGHV